MGMIDLCISILVGTFSYMDNVQRNLSRFTMGPLYLLQYKN